MKKIIWTLLVISIFLLNVNAQEQINKINQPSMVNSDIGSWIPENNGTTWTLGNDGDAIKVTATDAGTALTGKLHQRFTPSFEGEYTLTFKAKKDGTGNQTVSFNLLRVDQWSNLTNQPTVVISSDDFTEHSVTFTYVNDVKTKTPHAYQMEIIVNGVLGNLWFKDVCLYENNNIQTTYFDDFETDRYYGYGLADANSWTKTGSEGSIQRADIGSNFVLAFSQTTAQTNPWDITLTRLWWSFSGIQYRIQFDVSATTAIPQSDLAFECWHNFENKIIDGTYFPATTSMQPVNFITKPTPVIGNYSTLLYAGKTPSGEKLYIDNFLIEPIYLYNVEVSNVLASSLDVSWLHSGYLAGDKLDIILSNGSETTVMSDVEVIAGTATVDLSSLSLTNGDFYTIKIVDKVGAGDYAVNNEASSESFEYNPTSTESILVKATRVYGDSEYINIENVLSGSIVQIYTINGNMIKQFTLKEGTKKIAMEKGLYIVRVNEKTFKVIL